MKCKQKSKRKKKKTMNTDRKEEVVVVCVTGASGYIASYLVKILLLRGYTVHATLRNPNDGAKTEHLKTLEGANERLHLFKADLLEEGSFDSAINGCQGVFHTASPVSFNVTNPQREVLDPAQKGTLNVLAACKRSPTVRRVVFTSSMSSVLFNGVSRDPHVVVDESWFSKVEHCGEYPSLKWYVISKVLAEEAARNFCQENGIDMVSINPGMVIGPMLQPTLNSSVALIYDLINGSEALPDVALPWVHIKDVVEAHIQAFENPSAHGRYCLVESITHYSEIAKMLEKLYPRLQLSNKCFDISAKKFQVSKTKIKSLGIDYLPIEVSLKDTVENLKEKKYIHGF